MRDKLSDIEDLPGDFHKLRTNKYNAIIKSNTRNRIRSYSISDYLLVAGVDPNSSLKELIPQLSFSRYLIMSRPASSSKQSIVRLAMFSDLSILKI
jgi:hypothetical protein